MYETGEWSDLDIVTASRTFKVHKSVVCPKSPFFHAACTRGFQESAANSIELEEREVVLDAMLRHFYELPITWLQSERLGGEVYSRGQDAVHLMVAADKYGLEALGWQAYERFVFSMHEYRLDVAQLVDLGELFFSHVVSDPFKKLGGGVIAMVTGGNMRRIGQDLDVWKRLYANEEYLKLTVCYSAEPAENLPVKRRRLARQIECEREAIRRRDAMS